MSRALSLAVWCYAALLRLYPRRFHTALGGEMAEVFAATLADAQRRGALAAVRVCAREIGELPLHLAREHWRHWRAVWRAARLADPSTGWLPMDHDTTDRDEINLRPAYAGLLAGGLLALALLGLRGLLLPAQVATGWRELPPALALLGGLLAPLAPLAGGYAGARWGWAADRRAALRAGLLSGLLAGLLAWLTVGASAAGLAGQRELLLYGPRQAPEPTMLILLAEAVNGIIWLSHVSLWLLALGGAALGGLGGWLHGRSGRAGWGPRPQPVSRTLLRALALTLLFGAGLALLGSLAVWSAMPQRLDQVATETGQALRLPTWGAPVLPLPGLLAALAAALLWLRRSARPRGPARAGPSLLQQIACAGPPFAATVLLLGLGDLAALLLIVPWLEAARPSSPLIGLSMGFVATGMVYSAGLGALLLAALAPLRWVLRGVGLPDARLPRRPALRACLDYTLFAWLICAALAKLSVVASLFSIILGPITFIGVLTDGSSPPSVPETVQALVGSQLDANLVMLGLPLILVAGYTLYVSLYRRWALAAPDGGAALA